MFTGIVHSRQPIKKVMDRGNARVLSFDFSCRDARFCVSTEGLEKGASVSVAGVCLTVSSIDGGSVSFDVMPETLARTTLGTAKEGEEANIERSVKVGDEVGGHLLAGHIIGTAKIIKITRSQDHKITFQFPRERIKYIFQKGFIALDGCSLTVVDVDADAGTFTVSFIPETLARTTFGLRQEGDAVNVELDAQTVAVVETVERIMNHES